MLKRLLNLAGDKLHALPLLVLYLTDGCNSKCATCDIWRNPRRNMRPELVDHIAAAFPDLGVKHVLLSGGEAMQHPEWHTIAGKFRAAGARVMLLTNGLLLRKQADLTIANVDEVIVSLDGGSAATYQTIRGVDAFDLVLEGVRAVRAGGVPVTTRTTVQRGNFREIPQIIEAALAVDVNLISFLAVDVSSTEAFGPRFAPHTSPPDFIHGEIIPVAAVQNALDNDEIDELEVILTDVEKRYATAFQSGRIAESPAKLRRTLVGYFRAVAGQGDYAAPRCNAPHFSTVIDVDGTLRPCYFLPAYGKLKADLPLYEAINLPTAQALRQAYRTGQRAECARCVCPLYKDTRALLAM